MNIEISPRIVLASLLSIVLALSLLNGAGLISKYYLDHDVVFGLIGLFDFNRENNVPALFSACLLLLAACLLALIGAAHKRSQAPHLSWCALATIFLFLAIDEISSIHERFDEPTQQWLNTTGFLYFAWVIPYGIAVMLFVAVFWKFLFTLPRQTMYLFLISGGIYVTGALGFELLGGNHFYHWGGNNLTYALYYTSEEILEMIGMVLFIYTLISYAISQFDSLTIHIDGHNQPSQSTQ